MLPSLSCMKKYQYSKDNHGIQNIQQQQELDKTSDMHDTQISQADATVDPSWGRLVASARDSTSVSRLDSAWPGSVIKRERYGRGLFFLLS